MERLTYKGRNGKNYVRYNGYYNKCRLTLDRVADRLAAYEDTGLTPEEIVKMGMMFEDSKRHSGRLEGKLKVYEEAKVDGRLKFGGEKKSAPFPSMVVIFKGKGGGE